jgi:hypothetical protein
VSGCGHYSSGSGYISVSNILIDHTLSSICRRSARAERLSACLGLCSTYLGMLVWARSCSMPAVHCCSCSFLGSGSWLRFDFECDVKRLPWQDWDDTLTGHSAVGSPPASQQQFCPIGLRKFHRIAMPAAVDTPRLYCVQGYALFSAEKWTPWNRILLEKLIVNYYRKNSPSLLELDGLVVLGRPCLGPFESNQHRHTLCFNAILILSSYLQPSPFGVLR